MCIKAARTQTPQTLFPSRGLRSGGATLLAATPCVVLGSTDSGTGTDEKAILPCFYCNRGRSDCGYASSTVEIDCILT